MAFGLDDRTPVASGYFQVTVTDTAKDLATLISDAGDTMPANASANVCLIQIDQTNISSLTESEQAVRYREDGGIPTDEIGFVMGVGDYREFTNIGQINNVKFISAEIGVASITMNVQFYKK